MWTKHITRDLGISFILKEKDLQIINQIYGCEANKYKSQKRTNLFSK